MCISIYGFIDTPQLLGKSITNIIITISIIIIITIIIICIVIII